jgi:2-keto-myo-inositol isomerase
MPSPFTYCLNTSTIMYQPVMEQIRLAAKHGFGAIELWLRDVQRYVAGGGQVADVAKSVKDHGLFVPNVIAMHGWGDAPEGAYPAALDKCRRSMELAVQLGSKYIVATPPIGPYDLDIVSRRYRDLLAAGKQIGVLPTMEYLGFCKSVYRIDQLLKIVDEANDPAATVVLDSFHTYRGGSEFSDLVKVPIAKVAHYHLDDAPSYVKRELQMDPDRVMPGDGVLDLRREMTWLRDGGYRGCVSLELFNPTLWERDPNELLRVGIERMRMVMEG